MRIIIETIPHDQHRYTTCGDYWEYDDGTKHIVVSDMGDDDLAFLVGIHEMAEQYLCKKRGIKEEDVSAFDIAFEEKIATAIERLMCAELGRSWKEYEQKVLSLFE